MAGKVVPVTQAMIDRGIRRNSSKCVVANAVAAAIPDAHCIIVDMQTIRFTDAKGDRSIYLTPFRVAQYIVAFDAGDPIEPFSFTLRADQRIMAKQAKRTAAGLAIQQAQRDLRLRTVEALNVADDPTASIDAKATAQLALEEAKDELTRVREHYRGARITRNVNGVQRAAPPLGRRSNQRTYGSRALRINQPA